MIAAKSGDAFPQHHRADGRAMAAKRVTQKGREKRVAKRGAQAKSAAKTARGDRATSARSRKPSRAATADKRAAPAGPSAEVELEAAVLRRLLQHFDERKDVQNIELMILAGFCRNCLSRWLVEAAEARGVKLDMERAREKVYGMPYSEWKERHQAPATEEQLARFADAERRTAERRGGTKSST
jgi:hypothetical protein